jgi:prepilin-type N-terminal cleavage/methylation domain-containing protein
MRLTDLQPREGFSLLEILIVLSIMGLSAAIIMPNSSRMLDQATSHAVFFEFQRQLADLRREANRTGVALTIVDPLAQDGQADGVRQVELRSPWGYTLSPNLEIAEGGVCSPATVNLLNMGRVVMSLRAGQNCQLIRQQVPRA